MAAINLRCLDNFLVAGLRLGDGLVVGVQLALEQAADVDAGHDGGLLGDELAAGGARSALAGGDREERSGSEGREDRPLHSGALIRHEF